MSSPSSEELPSLTTFFVFKFRKEIPLITKWYINMIIMAITLNKSQFILLYTTLLLAIISFWGYSQTMWIWKRRFPKSSYIILVYSNLYRVNIWGNLQKMVHVFCEFPHLNSDLVHNRFFTIYFLHNALSFFRFYIPAFQGKKYSKQHTRML